MNSARGLHPMATEQFILCGGVRESGLPADAPEPVRLRLEHRAADPNVYLNIDDVRRGMYQDVPAAFLDLIDLACYVYAADQAVGRGGVGVNDLGERWRRQFVFR